MKKDCTPACFQCQYLDFDSRCAEIYDPTAPLHFSEPGQLNAMFERILTNTELAKYNPRAVRQPHTSSATDATTCTNGEDATNENNCAASLAPDGPWIVLLDDFLTPIECDTLIQLGTDRGYEQSTNVGARQYDGSYAGVESTDRTSHNTWCVEECWNHKVVQDIHKRLEYLTGVPSINYEYLQLLRYEEGQFYGRHHDFIEHHIDRAPGPRALTVFMYLNDVEAGGGTHFTDVNVTVKPKRGSIVIWPSVLDEEPMKMDERTHHTAQPVEAGIKFGTSAMRFL